MLKETRFDVCTDKTRTWAETTEKQRKPLIKVEADHHLARVAGCIILWWAE